MTPTNTVPLLAASALALTLAGCKVDNRPLLARFSGQPPPAGAALPQPGLPDIDAAAGYPADYTPPPPPGLPPAPVAERAYPYAERAYAMDRIAYAAPPAYGFAYGGEQPWAWQAPDDSLMFAEPYGDAYRFYYYEPGAAYPYFVRDPGYGYAYGPDGALLALFDAAGALIAADQYDRYYPNARSYWSRGYDLQRAYGGGRRYAVDPDLWAARAPRLRQMEQDWIAAPQRQPAWRDWRAGPGARFAAAALAPPGSAAPAHVDNGRHLGWERGRHLGWDKQAGGPRVASAAPPRQVEKLPVPSPHGRDRVQRPPQAAESGGPRPHGGRHAEFAGATAPQGGGRGAHEGGGHGRGGGPAMAQAAQPSGQNGGPGGGHGGGHGRWGGQPAAPAAAPPQGGGPHGQGGGEHGHGGGHGNGGGQGKGGGKDHGHGH
jgi:hypothetical protein